MDQVTTPAPHAFERKVEHFLRTSEDRAFVRELLGTVRKFRAGNPIANGDGRLRSTFVIHEGWVRTSRTLTDGKRQIIDYRLPGDFFGLASSVTRRLAYNLDAVTNVVVSEINMERLLASMGQSQAFARAILWSLSRDMAILAEHTLNVGSRQAPGRTAHFLLEIGYRLHQSGKEDPNQFRLNFTHGELAQAVAITEAHLSRILRQLRERGLLVLKGRNVAILQSEALAELADFDPSYLEPFAVQTPESAPALA